MFHDRKFESALERSIEGAAEADSLGGGADLGGGLDLGGEDLGGEEMGGEGEMPEEAGLEDVGPEEGDLLATPPGTETLPPAKRDDNMTVAKKGKAHHKGPNYHRTGRRRVHMRAKANVSSDQRGATSRSRTGEVFPGREAQEQARFGIYETLDSTYKKEEENILAMNNEIRELLDQLEDQGKK